MTRKCNQCDQPAEPGITRCTYHKAQHARNNVAMRARYKAEGYCQRCGVSKPQPGHKWCRLCCIYHAETKQKRRDALKALGLCPICGKRPNGNTRLICDVCWSKQKIR